ncbi:hypothetical protein RJ639_043743 [Escallonia herrerae]|uniref:Dof zinc finger protein n=1 Tax=Escallonia herrerae TaxID=1293975 RepID=A0AA89B8B8_9ASTE|nr:hypothetical protein RJ639_043743 [Escallonia herrerae]
MDTAQWPQEIVVKPMDEIVVVANSSTCSNSSSKAASLERRVRPQKEQAINCPRCNSTNTKFCYYNNYSLTQPRYFCKTCRRYWTEGGSLRNIPVGGGSRKNKRSSSSSSATNSSSPNSSSKKLVVAQQQPPPPPAPSSSQNPNKIHQDLNLGFPGATSNDLKTFSELIQVPNFDMGNNHKDHHTLTNSSSSSPSSHLSALELLTGITSSRGNTTFNSFMPMPLTADPNAVYGSSGLGFPLPEFKVPSSLSFSLDRGLGMNGNGSMSTSGYGGDGNGRILFPFEDLKQVSSNNATTATHDHHVETQSRDHHGDSSGFWNGMLGGGSW